MARFPSGIRTGIHDRISFRRLRRWWGCGGMKVDIGDGAGIDQHLKGGKRFEFRVDFGCASPGFLQDWPRCNADSNWNCAGGNSRIEISSPTGRTLSQTVAGRGGLMRAPPSGRRKSASRNC